MYHDHDPMRISLFRTNKLSALTKFNIHYKFVCAKLRKESRKREKKPRDIMDVLFFISISQQNIIK